MRDATSSREVGILFSDEMVRALVAGRKTQTRRIVKPVGSQKAWLSPALLLSSPRAAMIEDGIQFDHPAGAVGSPLTWVNLRWRVGDTLWVREAWCHEDFRKHPGDGRPEKKEVYYRATQPPNETLAGVWKPSIHMPRRFARILLRVTAVRPERVNAISEDDADAEGMALYRKAGSLRDTFAGRWNSMHGAGSFDSGAWVSVTTFERNT